MADFKLLNYAGLAGEARPGILVGDDRIVDLDQATGAAAWAASTLSILEVWDTSCAALHDIADAASDTVALADVRLLAPILFPPAI